MIGLLSKVKKIGGWILPKTPPPWGFNSQKCFIFICIDFYLPLGKGEKKVFFCEPAVPFAARDQIMPIVIYKQWPNWSVNFLSTTIGPEEKKKKGSKKKKKKKNWMDLVQLT